LAVVYLSSWFVIFIDGPRQPKYLWLVRSAELELYQAF
jgi:hypothetical protein